MKKQHVEKLLFRLRHNDAFDRVVIDHVLTATHFDERISDLVPPEQLRTYALKVVESAFLILFPDNGDDHGAEGLRERGEDE